MIPRRSSKSRRRGQSLIEFTFVGIPIMFLLISIFEISRGMWTYQTLAYSVKAGVRFAIVHGFNCVTAPNNTNSCSTTIAAIAQKIKDAGVGLDIGDSKTLLTFVDGTGTQTTCYLGGATSPCSALGTNYWPPDGANRPGQTIRIDIVTPFRSAIALFWPGAKPMSFGATKLPASSSDSIQF